MAKVVPDNLGDIGRRWVALVFTKKIFTLDFHAFKFKKTPVCRGFFSIAFICSRLAAASVASTRNVITFVGGCFGRPALGRCPPCFVFMLMFEISPGVITGGLFFIQNLQFLLSILQFALQYLIAPNQKRLRIFLVLLN